MKLDLKRLALVNEHATPDWMSGFHAGAPEALCSRSKPNESLLGLDRDGMAVFHDVRNCTAAIEARNSLPALLALIERQRKALNSIAQMNVGIASREAKKALEEE